MLDKNFTNELHSSPVLVFNLETGSLSVLRLVLNSL